MGFIFYLSSQTSLPGPELILGDFVFKKLAHMFVFGVLWYLLYRAYGHTWSAGWKAVCFGFVVAVLYAISDEFHQSMTPGRHPSIMDVGYDTLGMYLAYLRTHAYL